MAANARNPYGTRCCSYIVSDVEPWWFTPSLASRGNVLTRAFRSLAIHLFKIPSVNFTKSEFVIFSSRPGHPVPWKFYVNIPARKDPARGGFRVRLWEGPGSVLSRYSSLPQ